MSDESDKAVNGEPLEADSYTSGTQRVEDYDSVDDLPDNEERPENQVQAVGDALYINKNGQWLGIKGAGAPAFDKLEDLPPEEDRVAGDMFYVKETNQVYIETGDNN